MGGGRDKTGVAIYRRVNGVYIRRDGKLINHHTKYSVINLSRPVRPKRGDYADLEEYDQAKELYKKQLDSYNKEFDRAVQKALGYKRFNSKEEIENWAKKQDVIITPDTLNKIDNRAFNEISTALDEMFTRFPEAKNFSFEDEDGTLFQAQYHISANDDPSFLFSAMGGLEISTKNYSNFEDGLRDDFSQMTTGFTIKGDGTLSTTIRHEYGHRVDSYIQAKILDKYHYNVLDWHKNFSSLNEWKNAQKKAMSELKAYEKDLISLAKLQGSSEYSNTCPAELFAEGFAEYTSGGRTEFGRKFGQFLERWY
ncbi:MAG: hypothetical protein IJI57_04360 [Flexilinea sp.]|nr:hypothetical protein [Flexilinea sp.]